MTNADPNTHQSTRKYMRLKALDCFKDVLQMIRHGYPYTRIAAYIQEECGEYKDVQQTSLVKTLHRFVEDEYDRYEVAVDKNLAPQDELPPRDEVDRELRAKRAENINVLQEYGSLYRLQEDRVRRGVNSEKKANKGLVKEVGREIEVAARLLEQIGKVQQDLGMMPKKASQTEVTVKAVRDMSTDTARKIAEDPARRSRLLNFVQVAGSIDDSAMQSFDGGEVIDAEFEESEDGD